MCTTPLKAFLNQLDWSVWRVLLWTLYTEPSCLCFTNEQALWDTWNTRARPPKNQVPRRMTIMTLMALDSVPPRYSQLLRFAIIAAPHHR